MITDITPRMMRDPNHRSLRLFWVNVSRDGDFTMNTRDDDNRPKLADTSDTVCLHCVAYKFPTGKKDKHGQPIKTLCFGMQRPSQLGALPAWWGSFHERAVQMFMDSNKQQIATLYEDVYRNNPGMRIIGI